MAHSFTLLKAEVKVLQEANALKKKRGQTSEKGVFTKVEALPSKKVRKLYRALKLKRRRVVISYELSV